MQTTLALKDAKPLIEGSRRLVFQHPHESDMLVKVLKSEAGKEVALFGLPWLRWRRPNEMHRSFMREIDQYLRVRAAAGNGPLPIARVFGLVETDRGMGLVVEKIAGPDGGLAPSLRARVLARGFDRELEQGVLALRDELIRRGVVAGDINSNNVVWQHDSAGGRAVVVDGIGDKTFVPVNSLSAFVNRRSLMRRVDRLLDRLKRMEAVP